MIEIISFGHRCSSAGFIEMFGFKKFHIRLTGV